MTVDKGGGHVTQRGASDNRGVQHMQTSAHTIMSILHVLFNIQNINTKSNTKTKIQLKYKIPLK